MAAEGTAFYADPTFYVALSFFVFLGLLWWKKVHKTVATMLDEKAASIKSQLDEAHALRDEAEKLLSSYQKKQREAQATADAIIAQANEDAELMKEQAKKDIDEMVERRTRVAAEKITQLEALAVKDVQNAAVKVAVEAATKVLADSMKGADGQAMVDSSIAEVEKKLN